MEHKVHEVIKLCSVWSHSSPRQQPVSWQEAVRRINIKISDCSKGCFVRDFLCVLRRSCQVTDSAVQVVGEKRVEGMLGVELKKDVT